MTWNKNTGKRMAAKRMLGGLLVVVLLFGLVPMSAPRAQAASWMDPYVQTAVDWGVMKGDAAGNLHPERELTRAEFVAMVNRAFGYTEVGPTPFQDVPSDAWYAEDIAIAYNAGYFQGTGSNTASPNAPLTREQTAVLLGRNLRLQSGTGETMTFTDNRSISNWSRGLVESAANLGIIQGYDTGAFGPKDNILRGQVAAMLVRALGKLVTQPGEHTLGGVYGNLAINTAGVSLKNTVITGNLYLTGGVGLGDVELENVTVHGKIVVAGSGESQSGVSSVMLRNVEAKGLEVDSISGQFLTLSSEGLTRIADTTVRTSAYVQDLTRDGLGLKDIRFDGASGAQMQLAGNIKNLINLTPGSTLNFGQGVAHKVTIDEKAVGSTVNIDGAANLKELNLDVGTEVTGMGDVDHLNVSAAGSTVTMLPDTITIRPGITADIYGEEMDSTAAAESSEDPRILTGYPEARNVGSKTADVVFSTNKKGTLYWALTAMVDGSLGEEHLVNPPTVPVMSLKSGKITVNASKTEMTAKLSGLTVGGSYYVSAVLVDNRGMRSPVKVEAFATTDDTTPAFTTGYPKAILAEDEEENQIIQTQVMANKNCTLYYALMPQGATAPTAADFKSGALSGNLGYGTEELRKNTPWLVSKVNTAQLKEETTYDLYLWLNDVDSAKSSAVKKLTVTTPDRTPPVLQHMTVTAIAAKSVTLTYAANEPGTLYWAVVKEDADFYKLPEGFESADDFEEEEAAKIQIVNGIGAIKSGKSNASKAMTDIKFTISGLEAENGYDVYYVFVDKAGNYSMYSQSALSHPMTINTLDEIAPTVKQEFTRPGSSDNKNPTPYPDTSIRLIFSENVQGIREVDDGKVEKADFLDLYEKGKTDPKAAQDLAEALAAHIRLYWVTDEGAVLGGVRTAENEGQEDLDWLIDYRKAVVEKDDATGERIVTFPYHEQTGRSALNLASGGTYYFELEGIADTSNAENLMIGTRGVTQLPEFTTVFATVNLAIGNTVRIDKGDLVNPEFAGNNLKNDAVRIDLSFTMTPVSTEKVAEGTVWDMLLWTDTTMEYSVYSRTWDEAANAGKGDWGKWTKENIYGAVKTNVTDAPDGKLYASLRKYIQKKTEFENLNQVTEKTEFAIHVEKIESDDQYTAWNKQVTMGATVIAGGNYAVGLAGLANSLGYITDLDTAKSNGATSIGVKDPFEVIVPFTDSAAPVIKSLQVAPGDIGATMNVMIDRPGTVYYIVAPVTEIPGGYTCPVVPEDQDGDLPGLKAEAPTTPEVPIPVAKPITQDDMLKLKQPFVTTVTAGVKGTPGVISGNTRQIGANITRAIELENLAPKTTYLVYMVTKGVSAVYSDQTLCAQFTTKEAEIPVLNVTLTSSTSASIEVDKSSFVSYALMRSDSLPKSFEADFVGTGTWATDKSNYPKVKTVLDAMLTGYYDQNEYKGTVFDRYADVTTKNTYAELILQTTTESVESAVMKADDVSFTVPNGKDFVAQNVNMTGMIGDNWYTLLTVARTVNSSGYAFRASRSYYNVDNAVLTVTDCVLGPDTKPSDGKLYSGQLTVLFSDDLYLRIRDNATGATKNYPLDYCDLAATTHSSNNISKYGYANIGAFVDYGGSACSLIKPTGGGHEIAVGSSLKFTLTNCRPDTSITFNGDFCGTNGNVQSKSLVLKLTCNTVKNEDGTSEDVWGVTITPAWDATGQ